MSGEAKYERKLIRLSVFGLFFLCGVDELFWHDFDSNLITEMNYDMTRISRLQFS